MPVSFKNIVETILLEADSRENIYQRISAIYNSKKPSPSSLEDIARITSKLEAGGYGAIRNSTLNTMKPTWPFIDILDMLGTYLPNKKDIANIQILNTDIDSFLKNAGYDSQTNEYQTARRNILAKIDSLNNPATYTYTSQRLVILNNTTSEIALTNYRNQSPLQAVIEVTKKVGGYREADITDIMSFPLAYDLPTSIKLPELEPIRQLAFSLVTFYQNYLIQNLESLKGYLPASLSSKDNTEIANAIKNSAGSKNATNSDIKQDFVDFIKGRSRILQEIATSALPRQESFNKMIGQILNELSSAEIAAGGRRVYAPPTQQQTQQQTNQTQQQTPKPTRPVIKTLNDFSDIGDTAGQQVWNNYVTFFNSIKAGSVPSKWKVAGDVIGGIFKGVGELAGALGGFRTGL